MRIHGVEAIAIDIPLRRNFGGSTYAVLKRSTVVTRLRADDGLVSEVYNGDNPEHGLQFPGPFELSAMGAADKDLQAELPKLLMDAGIDVLRESVSWKHSSNGKYVSVRIAFKAESREQYDLAHEALRAHPEVKWTL